MDTNVRLPPTPNVPDCLINEPRTSLLLQMMMARIVTRENQQQDGGDDDVDNTDLHEGRATFFRRNDTAGYLDHGAFDSASLETPLADDNRGMKLLAKMGWQKGAGLGRNRTGIVQPIRLTDASLGYGLGKQEEYEQTADEATRTRRLLDIEVEETEELKKHRQDKAQRDETRKQEIKEMNRGFYCDLCDKQYKTVGEMSNHLSSYDHHHVKRLKEAKEAERARRAGSVNTAKQDRAKQDKDILKRVAAAQKAAAEKEHAANPPAGPPPAPQPHPPHAPPQYPTFPEIQHPYDPYTGYPVPHHEPDYAMSYSPGYYGQASIPSQAFPVPPQPPCTAVTFASPPPPPPPPPPLLPPPPPTSAPIVTKSVDDNRAPVKLSMSFGTKSKHKKAGLK